MYVSAVCFSVSTRFPPSSMGAGPQHQSSSSPPISLFSFGLSPAWGVNGHSSPSHRSYSFLCFFGQSLPLSLSLPWFCCGRFQGQAVSFYDTPGNLLSSSFASFRYSETFCLWETFCHSEPPASWNHPAFLVLYPALQVPSRPTLYHCMYVCKCLSIVVMFVAVLMRYSLLFSNWAICDSQIGVELGLGLIFESTFLQGEQLVGRRAR